METRDTTQKKLAILDDYFPNLKTGFRVSEFNYYMNKYPSCEIFSTRYNQHHEEYAKAYPQYAGKVKPFTEFDWTGKSYSLFYTVFLANAFSFYFVYELANTPFVFELYPGGGYWINDPEIDGRLEKVLKSPLLRKVIVTQKKTYDYILEKGFTTPDKIAYIYGMVTHPQYFKPVPPKKIYGKHKKTFDICFVGNKYMALGEDKGYPVFIEMCKRLASAGKDIMFHVVGGFDRDEIDVSGISDRIIFHGPQDHSFFPEFYAGMDIIVSPNIPFVLIPGKSYDGFPTGCCIDAALHQTAVFCTDELRQNEYFTHKKDIVIIPPRAAEIADSILEYYRKPKKLYELAANGQARFRALFDFNRQMEARAAAIEQFL